MGKKAKTSRKGKKAWRANISTEDVEDYVEQSNKEAVTGGSLADTPSDSLFYVDKSRDLSVKRKIEKHREKVLHCDSMLQRNPFVQPIAPSIRKKSKKKSKEIATAKASVQGSQKDQAAPESGLADIWNDNDGTNVKGRRKRTKTSVIPAVEIEPPGCSFNPDNESHQDSLACAVADEMQKVYRQELGPEPIPLTVPGEEVNEEEKYFLDADGGTDDEDANLDLVENADASQEKRDLKTKRVTRVEFNRRTRRKERLKIESESEKLKKLSAEIDGLPDIMQEIAKEDEEKEKRHLRRTIAKQERLKSFPPRLGKRKFEPAPMQVQLSDEITGSIRKLKGCCTLARDRYKSLEKRGLIIPTKKSGRK